MLLAMLFVFSASAQVTNVGTGTTKNDNTGDPLRTAFTKLNNNDNYIHGVMISNLHSVTATVTNLALIKPQWVDVFCNYAWSTVGPSAPALVDVTNDFLVKGLGFDNSDMLYATCQLPHNVAVTNASFPQFYFSPHIHFDTVGTLDATHSNVTWKVEWDLSSINGLFSTRGTNSVTVGVDANYTHKLASFNITNDPPPGISAIFRCRLTRPASVAQDYSNAHDVILDGFDLHIPVGNAVVLGSREVTTQ